MHIAFEKENLFRKWIAIALIPTIIFEWSPENIIIQIVLFTHRFIITIETDQQHERL